MRRRHNDPDELETFIEDETGEDKQGELYGAIQDNYSVQRNSAKARGLRAVIASPGCAVPRFTLRALHQLASPFMFLPACFHLSVRRLLMRLDARRSATERCGCSGSGKGDRTVS